MKIISSKKYKMMLEESNYQKNQIIELSQERRSLLKKLSHLKDEIDELKKQNKHEKVEKLIKKKRNSTNS